MGKIPMAEVGESEEAEFAVLQGTWMRRTGRTPIESNAAELQIQPFWPFGPLYTEGIISFGVIGIYKYHLTFYSLLRINTYVKILYFRYEVFSSFL